MQHVHTPADAVSKLKKAAKLRVRAAPNLLHAHALDQVAKEAGYRHWKHVTACATNSGSSSVAVATARTCTSDRHPMQLQDFTIVCGPSGSGKTLMAYDYALNAVREGRTVRVADVGGSYAKLAEVVGGTMLRVNSNGFNSQVFGDVPLTVADFEGAKAAGAAALDAGSFPFVTNAGAGEVWIVDETETLPLSVKWAAAGFDDTLLRWKMKPEVVHGEKKDIQPRVQARGGQAGHRAWRGCGPGSQGPGRSRERAAQVGS